jgi:hypothetical protein
MYNPARGCTLDRVRKNGSRPDVEAATFSSNVVSTERLVKDLAPAGSFEENTIGCHENVTVVAANDEELRIKGE